jgi:hypothetical protein
MIYGRNVYSLVLSKLVRQSQLVKALEENPQPTFRLGDLCCVDEYIICTCELDYSHIGVWAPAWT